MSSFYQSSSLTQASKTPSLQPLSSTSEDEDLRRLFETKKYYTRTFSPFGESDSAVEYELEDGECTPDPRFGITARTYSNTCFSNSSVNTDFEDQLSTTASSTSPAISPNLDAYLRQCMIYAPIPEPLKLLKRKGILAKASPKKTPPSVKQEKLKVPKTAAEIRKKEQKARLETMQARILARKQERERRNRTLYL